MEGCLFALLLIEKDLSFLLSQVGLRALFAPGKI
jgi:hypothetical protein